MSRTLPPEYYGRLTGGKAEEWIKVYVKGEYDFVQDASRSTPSTGTGCTASRSSWHGPCRSASGSTFGLPPAAIIGQRMPTGQIRWRHETVTERMGAKPLGEEIKRLLNSTLQGFMLDTMTGDPAGNAGSQTDEETPFRILRAAGLPAQPARTNDFELRREAVATPLGRLIDGEPGFIIHPECAVTRKCMMGAIDSGACRFLGTSDTTTRRTRTPTRIRARLGSTSLSAWARATSSSAAPSVRGLALISVSNVLGSLIHASYGDKPARSGRAGGEALDVGDRVFRSRQHGIGR